MDTSSSDLPSPDAGHPSVLAPDEGCARPPSPLRVLIADDSPFNQLQLSAVLSQWGIAPDTAGDGVQAAKLAQEVSYDLVFMDLDMPVMNGFEATRLIRSFERARPFCKPATVLAYSARNISVDDPRLAECGMNGTLPKPCDFRQVFDCLQRWYPNLFDRRRDHS